MGHDAFLVDYELFVPLVADYFEKVLEVGIKALIASECGDQHQGLEKPADVGDMPFDRTDVGHRLDHVVLGMERGTQCLGRRSYVLVGGRQC